MKKRRADTIAVIDADLIGRKKHRFPNLACEKISAYYKEQGNNVILKTDYKNLEKYKEVFISKVFTDTPIPKWLKETDKIHLGGTGFYFDQAPNLPDEIEHHMPDYHLYDEWVANEMEKGKLKAEKEGREFKQAQYRLQFREYLDYSIGFLTRGCFRKCGFCINKKYNHVFEHSPLEEFYDESRKNICLLDDNFLGYPHWKEMLEQLIATGRKFKFKQGLDERLLTDEKCDMLFNSKYDGDYTFAFDKVQEYDLIQKKLQMIRRSSSTNKNTIKFYVLVGFESTDYKDIENAFKRIELLFKYQCLPYVMRYQNKNEAPWKDSKYRAMYVTLARWSNQPSIVKKMSFRQFCQANQNLHKTDGTLCSSYSCMLEFEEEYPEIAKQYFDMRFEEMKCY